MLRPLYSRLRREGELRAGRGWRLLDTGVRSAAPNIALDQVLLSLRARDEIPDTLRFLQFSPPAVLIGRHQSVSQEVRQDFCREKGIEINRRLSGGGAVFLDTTQIGWEIVASRRSLPAGARLEELTEFVCRGAVLGLKQLGVSACFRPRNDIEVEGRKISGTGGAYDEEAFLLQGTLLVNFEVEAMIKALRVPTEKLSARELDSARQRVTCLAELLEELPSSQLIKTALSQGFSEALGISLKTDGLSWKERAELERRLPYYRSEDWINQVSEPAGAHRILKSAYRGKGGVVRSALSLDLKRKRIKNALFSGDFFIRPAQAVFDLEAILKDAPVDQAERQIRRFFAESRPEGHYLGADDFWQSLRGCLDKLRLPEYGIALEEANHLCPAAAVLRQIPGLRVPVAGRLRAVRRLRRGRCL
jgi:lipoate-protein ligase A